MTPFERLHPSIQHHIVNSLGWPSLRPLQAAAIGAVLAGHHGLLLAPTAGGKTEAALFPVLSRMADEQWRPLSVLYLAPLRALLNNLRPRLERYAGFTGHRVGLWHGDTGQGERTRLMTDPPDLLATTPESLEAMLISRRVNERWLFPHLRTVIVDEVHAFAGADRGWHLLAVLERLSRLAGRDLQRIGLSATVGNPDELLRWLCGSSSGPRSVIDPPAETVAEPEVTLDHVGSLDNAATVISRLHRGEKRLVFVDSRQRTEELAHALRARDVTTFVSHGSLGRDERRRAEQAFAEAADCVIVATSTLELGIDVGDLDRVIQIDAPPTVAGFLQRIGRTGRRAGTSRNALFLATSSAAFVQAAGLLRLWGTGFIEAAQPPPFPAHLLAQQLLALSLQEAATGLGDRTWSSWLGDPPVFGAEVMAELPALVEHLVVTGWLHVDEGLVSPGPAAEATIGRRNFLELTSAFVADPLVSVRHGRTEIGQVPDVALAAAFSVKDGPPALLLAGRAWRIGNVDWKRRITHVQPDDRVARIRFHATAAPLSFELCRSMAAVLAGESPPVTLTARARDQLDTSHDRHRGLRADATTVVHHRDGRTEWRTFAGLRANLELAARLAPSRDQLTQRDNVSITLRPGTTRDQVADALARSAPTGELDALIALASGGLKLQKALPDDLIHRIERARLSDPDAIAWVEAARVDQSHAGAED